MFKIQNLFFPKKNRVFFILFVCFPIFLILGNFFVNFFYLSIFILSMFSFKNNEYFLKNSIFYLLLIFFLYLIINLYFSINIENSFPRVIKFILIIIFINETQKVFKYEKSLFNKIVTFWLIIFLIVSFDIIFEFLFGFNTLGFRSPMWGRISSYFGDELVVGAFYHFFSLIIISYFLTKKFSNLSIIIIAGAIIIVSFIIGERANFIKLFLSLIVFLNFAIKINLLKKIISFVLVILTIFFIISSNKDLKIRYYNQIESIYSIDGIKKYFKKSQYGAHQSTAYQIFKNNFYFGVGIKNYREESKKEIYKNQEYEKTDWRYATHPHQLHLELLSEIGLIGYIMFLILILYGAYTSIINYLKFRGSYFHLATIVYLLISLIPLIPSGSIFSTFFGGIFWFNFGLMISLKYYSNFKS